MNKNIKLVIEQMMNMYTNNVICEYGNECFEGWCEDGDIFDYAEYINEEHLTAEDIEEMKHIMKRLAPFIDALTNEIERIVGEEK